MANPMGDIVEVRVPDIGDFKDVEVIELLVKPGDTIAVDQSLITVESDKASMEIPSTAAGVVRELKLRIGDKVSKSSLVLLLEPAAAVPAAVPAAVVEPAVADKAGDAAAAAPGLAVAGVARSPAPALAPAPGGAAAAAVVAGGESVRAVSGTVHASPSVRAMARELGVDLSRVTGSGLKGRVTHDDVRTFVKSVMQGAQASVAGPGSGIVAGGGAPLPAWPQVDFAQFGPIERVAMSRIRKISGPGLHRNWVSIPHVTNHEDADVTDLEAFRVQLNREHETRGIKVTMLAFLVKACVAALQRFPDFNSSLDAASGDAVIRKRYYHIGFAADTPNGLVVPVIRDADRKGVLEIAQEMTALAGKAREGKLSPAEMQGGTFSISSLGGIGGTYFTPIINAPEVAILGVCRAAMRPVWDGEQFVPRLILPMSLSWDHRVVDGAGAARFNAYLAQVLADFRRVLL